MFGWLKKLLGGEPPAPPPTADASADEATQKPSTVSGVAASFLEQNPTRTPWTMHALIAAGAARLPTELDLIIVCDKIAEHGYQYPLNPTIQNDLPKSEWLEFLRWQASADVPHEEFENENRIRALIDRYRADR